METRAAGQFALAPNFAPFDLTSPPAQHGFLPQNIRRDETPPSETEADVSVGQYRQATSSRRYSPVEATPVSATSELEFADAMPTATPGTAQQIEDALVALTSSLLIYPVACDQILTGKQEECANAYVKMLNTPRYDGEKKREDWRD